MNQKEEILALKVRIGLLEDKVNNGNVNMISPFVVGTADMVPSISSTVQGQSPCPTCGAITFQVPITQLGG